MGEISDVGVADLLYLLALRRQTGKLSISANGDEATLFLNKGQLTFVSSSNMALRLGRMLLRLGYLETNQLREALKDQEGSGKGRGLGTILLNRGWITDEELTRCVEEQCIEILARVIAADHGVFVYQRGVSLPKRTETVPLNSDRILLEATRRTDELVTLKNLLPRPAAPLMLGPLIDEQADTLSDAEVFVAAALQSGASSLIELTSRLGMEEVALWRTIVGMRERGLLLAGDIDSLEPRPTTVEQPAPDSEPAVLT